MVEESLVKSQGFYLMLGSQNGPQNGCLGPLVAIVGIISAILSGKQRPWGWSSKRPKPFLASNNGH